jgi:hypothetical protein
MTGLWLSDMRKTEKKIKVGTRVKLNEAGKAACTFTALAKKPKNYVFKGTVTKIREKEHDERYTVKMDDSGFDNSYDGAGYNRFNEREIEVIQDDDN